MMGAIVTSSPSNQDRPLLIHTSTQSSDQRRIRTLLDLLTIEKMDGADRTLRQEERGNSSSNSKWKILKERLGLKVISCCGVSTWRFENSSSTPEDNNHEDANVEEEVGTRQQSGDNNNNNSNIRVGVDMSVFNDSNVQNNDDVEVVGPTTGMNLAAALAAERQFRAIESRVSYGEDAREMMTPSRVSLMRLLEETTDGCDLGIERSSNGGDYDEIIETTSDSVCCVCMGREKGAAFIPCGHTYCRVCCRELWLNLGSCPLCNRRILEILDIF